MGDIERDWKAWTGPVFNKFSALLLVIAGLITVIAGFGAWRSPKLDWEEFQTSISVIGGWIGQELTRMSSDPFAFIGLIIMIVGVVATVNGIRRLF